LYRAYENLVIRRELEIVAGGGHRFRCRPH
jgi:hypothetical protein